MKTGQGHFVMLVLMSTEQIVALLIAERDRLTRAIEALQGPRRRRGRPSKSGTFSFEMNPQFVAVRADASKSSGRKKWTPAQKAEQAAKMRRYWAERRKVKYN